MPSRRHSLLRCTYSPKRSHAVTIEGTGTGARCCDGEVRAITVDGENVEPTIPLLEKVRGAYRFAHPREWTQNSASTAASRRAFPPRSGSGGCGPSLALC